MGRRVRSRRDSDVSDESEHEYIMSDESESERDEEEEEDDEEYQPTNANSDNEDDDADDDGVSSAVSESWSEASGKKLLGQPAATSARASRSSRHGRVKKTHPDNDVSGGRKRCLNCGKVDEARRFYSSLKLYCSQQCRREGIAKQDTLGGTPKANGSTRRKRPGSRKPSHDGSSVDSAATPSSSRRGSATNRQQPTGRPPRGDAAASPAKGAMTNGKLHSHVFATSPSVHPEDDSEDETQLFSTEYITAMRADDNETLTNYKEITDPWKHQYDNAIQIPNPGLSSKPRPDPTPAERPFPLRTFKQPFHFVRSVRNQDEAGGLYDLDNEDEHWLRLYNSKAPSTRANMRTLEQAFFIFEREAFNGLARERGTKAGAELDEDDAVCDVCKGPDSEEGNEMVFCDGCNVCVHQICYGIKAIPEGNWYCRSCLDKTDRSRICVLCPARGGALKPVQDRPNDWAHLSCALWVNEATIVDVQKMEPISIEGIPESRYDLECSLCQDRSGACIQCAVKVCTTAFHVSCAHEHHLRMDVKHVGGAFERDAFCPKHRFHQLSDEQKAALQMEDEQRKEKDESATATSARHEFHEFVNLTEVADEMDGDPDVIRDIYAYWVQKRRRQHGRPLMRQFISKISAGEAGSDVERSEMWGQLQGTRLSLERARSLCDMVHRRETKKRDLIRTLRREFTLSVNSFAQALGLDLGELCGPGSAWAKEETGLVDDDNRARWKISGGSVRHRMTLDKGSTAAAGSAAVSRPNIHPRLQVRMQQSLDRLQTHKDAKPFCFPVDKHAYPDYYIIITKPMDFATVQSKLRAGEYQQLVDFFHDVDLIFKNCMIYNAEGSHIWNQARRLADVFRQEKTKLRKVKRELDQEAESLSSGPSTRLRTSTNFSRGPGPRLKRPASSSASTVKRLKQSTLERFRVASESH